MTEPETFRDVVTPEIGAIYEDASRECAEIWKVFLKRKQAALHN
jgi:hypothetical protein